MLGLASFSLSAKQRHHEARRAEAALRAVALHHRLLHRMQAAIFGLQMLDREKLAAVQRRQEADAGIDRLIASAGRRRARPMTTVQAPQSPSAQPSLLPVMRRRGAASRAPSGSDRSEAISTGSSPRIEAQSSHASRRLGRSQRLSCLRLGTIRAWPEALIWCRCDRELGRRPPTVTAPSLDPRAARGRLLWFTADPHDCGRGGPSLVEDGLLVYRGRAGEG